MTKQSIFGRISTLVRANINALLDSAEDPQKMLDQLVRDYTNSIADAESAIAETIGNLRLLERDHEEDVQAATEWGNKALAASRKADEMRGSGNSADADKFDNLAKIALQRQISAEREATSAEPQIAAQTEIVDKLKSGLNGMKDKLNELKNKRSELLARAKVAEAQTKVQDAVSSINVLDPTSELGRFEDKVRRQEALAQGKAELAASSLDAQFESLEDLGELTEVEARLAELKAGGSARGRRSKATDTVADARAHARASAVPSPGGLHGAFPRRAAVAGFTRRPRDAPRRRRVGHRGRSAACGDDRPRRPRRGGESLGTGVRRLSALARTRELVAGHLEAGTVLIGGDCSITVAALDTLPGGTDDLAVVWCDAHADLHTPDTSPSGAFSGMALRAVLGEGEPQLALSPASAGTASSPWASGTWTTPRPTNWTASGTSGADLDDPGRSPTPCRPRAPSVSGSTSTSTSSIPRPSPGSPLPSPSASPRRL